MSSHFLGKPARSRATSATTSVDFRAVAESVDLPALLAREGIEVRNGKALCPFHDNTATPALSIFLAEGRWRYRCHGCGVAGDSIAWIAARAGITAIEAARKLGGDEGYTFGPPTHHAAPRPAVPEIPEPWRDAEWQRAVDALIGEAVSRLWSGEGIEAMGWLRARGLADHTIRRFRLGFLPTLYQSSPIGSLADERGEGRLHAPRGITIPWLAPGGCYSEADASEGPRWVGCNVRRLAHTDVSDHLPAGVEKCQTVRGSRRGYLYPWPEILPTQGELPMLLVEGEFDALIAVQEFGHRLHVATVGSASVRSLSLASRSALAVATWILLAMDHDRAGVGAAWSWREKYPHKSRRVLLPFGKDLSDFINGAGDGRVWISEILEDLAGPPGMN